MNSSYPRWESLITLWKVVSRLEEYLCGRGASLRGIHENPRLSLSLTLTCIA